MATINIFCENTNTIRSYPLGITLDEIKTDMGIKLKYPVLGTIVNNKVKELPFAVVKSKKVRFIDYSNINGRKLYIRSMMFLLHISVKELYPHVKLRMPNGISEGTYCELIGLGRKITNEDLSVLKENMLSWVKRDIPFVKKGIPTSEAVEELVKQGMEDKAKLLEQQGLLFAYLYYLDDYANFFYGHHVPSTGYLTNFDLVPYLDGFLLRYPKSENFDELDEIYIYEKLYDVFKEHKKRADLLNVSNVGMLNEHIMKGKGSDIIKIAEALHEKKVIEIADMIDKRRDDIKLILISGPSSSGKTTSSKRLSVQLAVNGIIPHVISLDDYFVNREHTPVDENGNHDFEALETVDTKFFNEQLNQLFNGEEVNLPRFNFITGKREFSDNKLQISHGHVLIVEGIHGMNPKLVPGIDEKWILRIFLSALTQTSFDDQNHISTTDNRLLRRMIRDSKYRGYSAAETLKRWPSVRKGEEKNIFPYQENADIMFNTALIYELAVLRKYAEPLLKSVSESEEEYCEANRLLKFLSYFSHLSDKEIPPTSLLREFLGGSSFRY